MARLMTLTIRIAAADEADAIEEVMRDAYDVLGRRDYDDRQIASALTHVAYLDRALVEDATYFVVEEDGVMVGGGGWSKRRKLFNGVTASAADRDYLDPLVDPARVRAMFVHPRWERRGIGRMIVAACEDAARAAGFTRVELLATLNRPPALSRLRLRTAGRRAVDDAGRGDDGWDTDDEKAKSEGRSQKAEVAHSRERFCLLPSAFCLLTFRPSTRRFPAADRSTAASLPLCASRTPSDTTPSRRRG